MSENPPIRASVYGSCVARDTIEAARSGTWTVNRYIARQSLISAFSGRPSPQLDPSSLQSQFQQRMLLGDLKGSFSTLLSTISADSDILLWDLTDERFGVYETAEGAIITRSLELIASGHDGELRKVARYIPFGSDDHFRLWQLALTKFFRIVTQQQLVGRVALIALPWAELDDRSQPVHRSNDVGPKTANRLYRRYYRSAGRSFNTIRLRQRDVRASSTHKWGLAPFHYTPETYQSVLQRLEKLVL